MYSQKLLWTLEIEWPLTAYIGGEKLTPRFKITIILHVTKLQIMKEVEMAMYSVSELKSKSKYMIVVFL